MQMTYPTNTQPLAVVARLRGLAARPAVRTFLDDMIRGLALLPPSNYPF